MHVTSDKVDEAGSKDSEECFNLYLLCLLKFIHYLLNQNSTSTSLKATILRLYYYISVGKSFDTSFVHSLHNTASTFFSQVPDAHIKRYFLRHHWSV